MVGYCLGLSNACPVHYGLLFERFTDPDRSEYPDIDIDICQDGRAEVIDYVRRKYGHVAQIITFGRMMARAVVRDVGRAMGLPYKEVDRIAKQVPAAGVSLAQAIKDASLQRLVKDDPRVAELLQTAVALEGLPRHASTHAAGVVISASHNLFEDNGIKFFGRDGFKIADGQEALKGKIIRVSNMGYIDEADLLGVLSAIERCMGDMGQPVDTGAGVAAAQQVFASA